MNIVMMTNTYTPHVGGVAVSVETFTQAYRALGHHVLVVAPEFENQPADEDGVLRLPAFQHFNGSDFSVVFPIPVYLSSEMNSFKPDIIHSHHPFMLGDTALRIAAVQNVPLVFTHHTMHDRYTHYVPGDSPVLRRFVIELSTGYANLANHVVAPSDSIAAILRKRGVHTPVSVIPTGIDVARFSNGQGDRVRRAEGIPPDALVVGHAGRLAPEKNLLFLARSVSAFLRENERAHFLVVGSGPSREGIEDVFRARDILGRLHFAGSRTGQDLVDLYHAMGIFAFASQTETQAMVLAEAMAAGVPVVAVDAPGAREIVADGLNGRLLPVENEAEFARALPWVSSLTPKRVGALKRSAWETVRAFSRETCTAKMLALYGRVLAEKREPIAFEEHAWSGALRAVEEEWSLWSNRVAAVAEAALHGGADEEDER